MNHHLTNPAPTAWTLVLATMIGLGGFDAAAQDPFAPPMPARSQSDRARPRRDANRGTPAGPLTPVKHIAPVPLQYGYGSPTPLPMGPNAPMAIGPAPFGPVQYGSPVVFGPQPGYFAPPVYAASPFLPSEVIRNPFVRPLGPQPVFPDRTITQVVGTAPQSFGPSNLLVSVSEAFLNRLVAHEEVQPGPVRDFVLGADVTGHQTTTARLKLDLKPSANQGHAALVLTGDIHMLTTGVTPQAMVDVAGQQQFVAMKDVYFDGRLFSTRHATVFVRSNNQTLGAMTPLTGTLLGGIADRIAFRVAERRRPETEAIARDKVAEKVYPMFDGEIDKQLTKANQLLERDTRPRLATANLLPSSQSVATTDDRLYYSAQIGAQDSATGTRSPLSGSSTIAGGLNLSLHESLFNELIGRANLKGLHTTDKELQQQLDSLIGMLDGVKSSRGVVEETPTARGLALPKLDIVTDIELDDTDPLTVRLHEDRLIATLKAKFKPAGQNLLPPMKVEIEYKTVLEGDTLRLVPGTPRATAQDRRDPSAEPTLAEQAVQLSVASALLTLELNRSLPASIWPHAGTPPRITSIRSQDGWSSIAID